VPTGHCRPWNNKWNWKSHDSLGLTGAASLFLGSMGMPQALGLNSCSRLHVASRRDTNFSKLVLRFCPCLNVLVDVPHSGCMCRRSLFVACRLFPFQLSVYFLSAWVTVLRSATLSGVGLSGISSQPTIHVVWNVSCRKISQPISTAHISPLSSTVSARVPELGYLTWSRTVCCYWPAGPHLISLSGAAFSSEDRLDFLHATCLSICGVSGSS